VVFTRVSGSGCATGYASVIDNHSSDPYYIPGLDSRSSDYTLYMPAAAATAGAYGTHWRTDLRVLNPGASQSVFLAFLPNLADNRYPVTHAYSLAPGEVLALDDAVVSLGGSGGGALLVRATTPVYATARTYNVTASGTLGQLIPGARVADSVGLDEGAAVALAAQGSADFRSNAGFLNPTPYTGTVELRIVSGAGVVLGRKSYPLKPYSPTQVNDVFTTLQAPAQADCRVETEVTEGQARALGYLSVIDNHSGDPIHVPSVPVQGGRGEVVVAHGSRMLRLDQRTEVIALDVTSPNVGEIQVTGDADLGASGGSARGVLLYADSSGNLYPKVLVPGEMGPLNHYAKKVWAFIPDCFRKDDNTGSLHVSLLAFQDSVPVVAQTFDINARTNCILVDQLAEAVHTTAVHPSYAMVPVTGTGSTELPPNLLLVGRTPRDGLVTFQIRDAEQAQWADSCLGGFQPGTKLDLMALGIGASQATGSSTLVSCPDE
jgi:hypothetical protein